MTTKGGAYVHIPFCRRKCAYCDFYSLAATDRTVDAYADALCRQIMTDTPGFAFDTVYIGGGTPSLLSPARLASVLDALTLVGGKAGEVTVEVNPESVTADFLDAAKGHGVNRVSMGVQSFDDEELKALGRLADRKTCLDAYDLIRSRFDNVSMDLMLAIPGQTEKSLKETLSTALSLDPEHLSAYLLKVEPDTPFGRAGVTEADEEIQRAFYLTVSDTLRHAGYEHYEISNFAKPGFRSRHNSSYWSSLPYAAYGAGAHGFDGTVRYSYAPDAGAFIAQNGAVDRIPEEILDDASRREERIMLGLRTSDGIPASLLDEAGRETMEKLIPEGLCVRTRDGYALTPKGFPVSDAVILSLL